MRTRGFTIVELLVVITVMAILIPVTMFSIGGLNKTSRDRERESDVSSIARQLELVYTNKTVGSSPTYPGTTSLGGSATPPRESVFGGSTSEITKAPNSSGFSIVAATNTTATTSGVRPVPTPTTYVYQPIPKSGSAVCTSLCSSFNLYYLNESDSSIIMVKSQRQQ